ncbi:hemolysin III family protein [uncultured Eudoraea sp.]|uniref:PAQR family membrane homeostasis protein TrhA n=1 Tax=uncultured Eudoraea sp. TaxID=1035614 RepID=UPI00262A2D89|nr:hemolysin III family protein [uncultured Eudoraea sp.]
MKIDYHKEEKLNAISHAIGIMLGILGFYLLLKFNANRTEYATISVIIYSTSIILLFSASTLYHYISTQSVKMKLRVLDHICIYYLIAGTYTPVALITLEEGNGWLIFYTVWGIALGGTILKLFFTGKFEIFSLLLYLFMGWLIVFDLQNLLSNTSKTGLYLLMLGGAFYTIGIFFYAFKRIPHNHLIWHFLVLAGAISHWLYIAFAVI